MVVDASPMYGRSEGVLGDLIEDLALRPKLWIATKVWTKGREAENRLLPFCRDHGIAVMVNRPFADGAVFQGVRDKPLPAVAREIGIATWGQFFLKRIVAHPAVTCVIPATSKSKHMLDNCRAGFGPLPDARKRDLMAQAWK